MVQYFEDIKVGGPPRESSESYKVNAEEIKRFAAEFDPMPFHLDEEAATQSAMGALCASGMHTIALGLKLAHNMPRREEHGRAVLAGLGWDEVRFSAPLFVGDEIRVRAWVCDKRPSKTKADRGIVKTRIEIFKQDGTVVASYTTASLIARRTPVGGSDT